jgi:hypothetical protein
MVGHVMAKAGNPLRISPIQRNSYTSQICK